MSSSSNRSHHERSELESLKFELERQAMLNEALWRLIRDRLKISDEELIRTVTDVDLEDGHLDGRNRKRAKAIDCTRCKRPNNSRRVSCMYCGEPIVRNPFE